MEANIIHHNVSLKEFNSWRVGGIAKNFYICTDISVLSSHIKEKLMEYPLTFIGLGSNTLFRDGVIEGTIIMMNKAMGDIVQEHGYFYAEAGISCSKLAKHVAKTGHEGSAFLAGIPGTVGGALAMNAGCYGSEAWDFVSKVLLIDLNGNQVTRYKDEFDIGYRKVINNKSNNEYFLGAWFIFPEGKKEVAENAIKNLLRHRKETQPLNWPTAGSTFRNPPNNFAAKLIEDSDLKGFSIGGAQVSTKHANFIINLGNASAFDIEKLIKHIKIKVFEVKKITLETEIRFIGEEIGSQ
jgi:UDP-N-acetylmuramate dehydrogenase